MDIKIKSHELTLKYLDKTYDFSNNNISSFTNLYITTYDEILTILKKDLKEKSKIKNDKFYGRI